MKPLALAVSILQAVLPLEAAARERDGRHHERGGPRFEQRRPDPGHQQRRPHDGRDHQWRQRPPAPPQQQERRWDRRPDERRRWDHVPQQPPHRHRWVSPPSRHHRFTPHSHRSYNPFHHRHFRHGHDGRHGTLRWRGRRWIIWGGVGIAAMWTTLHLGRAWWWDADHGRWCYRHNDRWYWQDYNGMTYWYDETSGQYYHDANAQNLGLVPPDTIPPSGQPDESEIEPDTEDGEEQSMVSPDNTRRVEITSGQAYLHAVNDSGFAPVWLGGNVQRAYFQGDAVIVEFSDGRREAYNYDGMPMAVPTSAPDMPFEPLEGMTPRWI